MSRPIEVGPELFSRLMEASEASTAQAIDAIRLRKPKIPGMFHPEHVTYDEAALIARGAAGGAVVAMLEILRDAGVVEITTPRGRKI